MKNNNNNDSNNNKNNNNKNKNKHVTAKPDKKVVLFYGNLFWPF